MIEKENINEAQIYLVIYAKLIQAFFFAVQIEYILKASSIILTL